MFVFLLFVKDFLQISKSLTFVTLFYSFHLLLLRFFPNGSAGYLRFILDYWTSINASRVFAGRTYIGGAHRFLNGENTSINGTWTEGSTWALPGVLPDLPINNNSLWSSSLVFMLGFNSFLFSTSAATFFPLLRTFFSADVRRVSIL